MTDRELMQQALDAMLNFPNDISDEMFEAMKALKARLAQPDLITPADVEQLARIEKLIDKIDPYEAQPEPEPVAWLYKKKDGMQVITDDPDYADGTWTPLYTDPPQREFIGMTDEEIEKMIYNIRAETMGVVAPTHLARVIQQTLREKNA